MIKQIASRIFSTSENREMPLRQERFELKYYINALEMEKLSIQLKHVLRHDVHANKYGEYIVRSLYFDSPNDECLAQKQSGDMNRTKLRLRTYGKDNNGPYKFELKHKRGQTIFKESAPVSEDLAREVCSGEYGSLLNLKDPILDKVYALLICKAYRPKVIVEYTRQAYTYAALNIRITFDKDLHSSIGQTDLFSPHTSLMPVILEGKQILEVKYDHHMPVHFKRLLSSIRSERMAISKYTLARRFQKIRKWEDN